MHSAFLFAFFLILTVSHARKEAVTGKFFPDKDGMIGPELAGVGVRVKTIGPVKAKVYAAGMYMARGKATGACKGIECKSAKELADSTSFGNAISHKVQDWSIILKMVRSVGQEKMVAAVADSVKPRLKGDAGALSKFESILASGLGADGAKDGMELGFRASGGKMTISINGKNKGSISSKPLCKAFMGVYIDGKCVAPSLKQSVADSIYSWM